MPYLRHPQAHACVAQVMQWGMLGALLMGLGVFALAAVG